jgi:DNA-binding HxlR family transcriptional regulator
VDRHHPRSPLARASRLPRPVRGTGGISDSVLSERLADLAAGGLITRTVRDGPPVTVTYQLTERGRALMPALDQIAQWARDNLPPDKC